jgi:hypothetical protein
MVPLPTGAKSAVLIRATLRSASATFTAPAQRRDNTTGDTWIETISNAGFVSWHQIGGSDTHYSVVGVADFYGNATDDILFRNNSTGDTWFEAISNGAFNGWNQIGGSNTSYAAGRRWRFLRQRHRRCAFPQQLDRR